MKAFLKKEWMEGLRTGRTGILLLLFALFGVMNPAIAKLTPWLIETMSESFASAGIVTTAVTVDAMFSWMQFYKNAPMALLLFLLLSSGSFTAEYQKGTLIPTVAKGLPRWKILAAKALALSALWTALYFLCYGITYGYNAYFWDNHIAAHLLFAAACYWMFGIWLLALLVLFSTLAKTSSQVLLGIGAAAIALYALSVFPKCSKILPLKLMDAMPLLQSLASPQDYYAPMALSGITALLCIALSIPCFNRKYL